MIHLGTKILETERLILRPFRAEDAIDMYNNWAGNDHVTQFLTWQTHTSVEVSKRVISDWLTSADDLQNYQWCIEYKENHQAIGSIGQVSFMEATESLEIGYCIGEDYWRKGIMTEALREVIRFFFRETGVNRVAAVHDVNNKNSGRVMIKAGLLYEGTMKEAGRNNLGLCDIAIYGLTKKMYLTNERS